ncbi:hypothetical protein D3C75_1318340 [compost metagenome]
MAQQQPGLAEDFLQFDFVEFAVMQDAHGHFAALLVDQILDWNSVGQYAFAGGLHRYLLFLLLCGTEENGAMKLNTI